MADKVYKTPEKKRARHRQRYQEDANFRNYMKEYTKTYRGLPGMREHLTKQGHEWRHRTKYGMTIKQRSETP